jgi:hypothetical protein
MCLLVLPKFGSKLQKTQFELEPNWQFRFRFSTYPELNLQFSFQFRKCQKYAELLPYKARVQVQTRFETRPNWQFRFRFSTYPEPNQQFGFWFSKKVPNRTKLDFSNTSACDQS